MNIFNKRKNTYSIYWIWVKCIVRATYMNISNQSDKITSPSPPCRFQCSAAVLFFAAVHPGFQRLRRNGNLKTSADLLYYFLLTILRCVIWANTGVLVENQFRSIPATHSNGTHTVHRIFSRWATKRFSKFLNFSSKFVQVVAWLMCWLRGTKRGHVLKLPQTYHFKFHSSSTGSLTWN